MEENQYLTSLNPNKSISILGYNMKGQKSFKEKKIPKINLNKELISLPNINNNNYLSSDRSILNIHKIEEKKTRNKIGFNARIKNKFKITNLSLNKEKYKDDILSILKNIKIKKSNINNNSINNNKHLLLLSKFIDEYNNKNEILSNSLNNKSYIELRLKNKSVDIFSKTPKKLKTIIIDAPNLLRTSHKNTEIKSRNYDFSPIKTEVNKKEENHKLIIHNIFFDWLKNHFIKSKRNIFTKKVIHNRSYDSLLKVINSSIIDIDSKKKINTKKIKSSDLLRNNITNFHDDGGNDNESITISNEDYLKRKMNIFNHNIKFINEENIDIKYANTQLFKNLLCNINKSKDKKYNIKNTISNTSNNSNNIYKNMDFLDESFQINNKYKKVFYLNKLRNYINLPKINKNINDNNDFLSRFIYKLLFKDKNINNDNEKQNINEYNKNNENKDNDIFIKYKNKENKINEIKNVINIENKENNKVTENKIEYKLNIPDLIAQSKLKISNKNSIKKEDRYKIIEYNGKNNKITNNNKNHYNIILISSPDNISKEKKLLDIKSYKNLNKKVNDLNEPSIEKSSNKITLGNSFSQNNIIIYKPNLKHSIYGNNNNNTENNNYNTNNKNKNKNINKINNNNKNYDLIKIKNEEKESIKIKDKNRKDNQYSYITNNNISDDNNNGKIKNQDLINKKIGEVINSKNFVENSNESKKIYKTTSERNKEYKYKYKVLQTDNEKINIKINSKTNNSNINIFENKNKGQKYNVKNGIIEYENNDDSDYNEEIKNINSNDNKIIEKYNKNKVKNNLNIRKKNLDYTANFLINENNNKKLSSKNESSLNLQDNNNNELYETHKKENQINKSINNSDYNISEKNKDKINKISNEKNLDNIIKILNENMENKEVEESEQDSDNENNHINSNYIEIDDENIDSKNINEIKGRIKKDLNLEKILIPKKTKKSKKANKFSNQENKEFNEEQNPELEYITIKRKKRNKFRVRNSFINELKNIETEPNNIKSKDGLNEEDMKQLIIYSAQLRKINELNEEDKTEEIIQLEKDIKQKYNEILHKYITKKKHKALVKKKEKNKKKLIMNYDENNNEDEFEVEVKLKEEKKEEKKYEKILIESESESIEKEEEKKEEVKENKLIYDNKEKNKKHNIEIKKEVLDILNKKYNSDESKNEKLSENKNYFTSNITPRNKKIFLNNKRESKIKYKKRIRSNIKPIDKYKLSLFTDIKEEIIAKSENKYSEENDEEKEEQNKEQKEKLLDKKIKLFFEVIQKMKKSGEDFDFYNILKNDEIKDRENIKRLIGFNENISNSRDNERGYKPKFNFLSPIKFKTSCFK